MIDPDLLTYYERSRERERLTGGGGSLELVRTQEILERVLPPPPAVVLDVGGGSGTYAAWLARGGYQVHLSDLMPLHVAQAVDLAASQPEHSFTAAVGDARQLDQSDASVDVALLLGPLYHLTERADRMQALREAHRVLRPGGLLVAAAISRFAVLLDALRYGYLVDPDVTSLILGTAADGQHRNPRLERYPNWFATAFFHLPEELAEEVTSGGFEIEAVLAVEGPAWFISAGWQDPAQRDVILEAVRQIETEPSLLGMSPHLLAIARNV